MHFDSASGEGDSGHSFNQGHSFSQGFSLAHTYGSHAALRLCIATGATGAEFAIASWQAACWPSAYVKSTLERISEQRSHDHGRP